MAPTGYQEAQAEHVLKRFLMKDQVNGYMNKSDNKQNLHIFPG